MHAAPFWVGLGSFAIDANAADFQRQNQPAFAEPLRIHEVQSASGLFYRVVLGPYATEALAREALGNARRRGHTEAWFVATTPAQRVIEPRLPTKPRAPVEPQIAVPKPARTEPALEPEVASPAAVQPVPVPADLGVSLAAGQRLALVRLPHDAIRIDGFVNEAAWQKVPVIDEFVTIEPDTLVPGKFPTRLRLAYNERGLYVSAEMQQPQGTLVRRLTGRDVRDNRDSLSVTIDTSGEGRYGFWFGINLGDSLMDGTVLPERVFSNEWDGPWYGRSQSTDEGWSAEMFIPWSVVSMPASGIDRSMGMYVSRKVAHLDERWAWPALAPTQAKFMSVLAQIEMRDVKPRQQYNIYPFVSTSFDFVDDEPQYQAGADMFWRPSSNFQMNATLNPDFGNVESDDVVVNLTATETFFPEKRLFFLEGQEIFVASPRADTRSQGVGQGGLPYTMVNTRRIGGKPLEPLVGAGIDVSERELVQQTELSGAVKTTGQFGNFRYGVMGAFEDEVKFDVLDAGQPRNLHQAGNDYGIARLLYEGRSDAGAYRSIGVLSTAVLNDDRGDALAQGLDVHYLSATGGVKIDGQFMTSDLDRAAERGYGGFVDFEFTYRQGLKHRVGLEYFDEHFDINDLGFLQRNDEYRVRSAVTWTRSDLDWARENQLDVRGFVQKNKSESLLTGAGVFIANRTSLNNLSQLTARLGYMFPQYDDLNSFGNGTYRVDGNVDINLSWETDTTRPISVELEVGYAEDKLGDPGYSAEVELVWRPSHQIAVELEAGYKRQEGWLLHQNDDLFATFEAERWLPSLSVEYFISARQQVRLALQWVGIRAEERDFYRIPGRPDDLLPTAKPTGPGSRASYDFAVSQYSLQLRYRWEIAPLSDIFLVYTRQANLATALGEAGFNDLFNDAWQDPLADLFVFKMRYRFGS